MQEPNLLDARRRAYESLERVFDELVDHPENAKAVSKLLWPKIPLAFQSWRKPARAMVPLTDEL